MTIDTKPRRTRAAVCPITTAAMQMVVERGHLGITNNMLQQATGRCSNTVGTVLAKLTHRGRLAVGRLATHPHHWFANQELAQRWMSTTPPLVKPIPAPRQRILHRQPRTAAQNPRLTRQHGAPVVLGRAPDTTDDHVVVPAGLAIQRLATPTHDARYQCAPGERPHGAGFAAAGIGRDVTTGQQWGQQA